MPINAVAAQERHVTPTGNERFQMISHGGRPILIMPDAQDELVVVKDLRAKLEIGVDGVVDFISRALGPLDKRMLPVPPATLKSVKPS